MSVYYLKFDYPDWGNLYHKVVAPTKEEAITKILRGTKDIPRSKVHVWKGHGLPKRVAGRRA